MTPDPIGTGARRRRFGAAVGLAVCIAGAAHAAAVHRPLTFLVGDGPYYAATAVSILHDGDLDLRNQLRGGPVVHGAQIALGRDGRTWYPKHPILMPLAALPFLALFGMDGFLVFNIVVLGLLAAAMALFARRHAGAAASALAVALLLGGTFLRGYVYNLSPDLFATLFVLLGATALGAGRAFRAGLLLGAAVAAKFLLAVLLPWAAFAAWRRHGVPGALRLALGLAPAMAGLLALNAALFGSPWITSYDRGVAVHDGTESLITHRTQFDGPVLAGLAGEILDPVHGLLPTSPVLLLAIPGWLLLARRDRGEALMTAAAGLTLLLVLAPYRGWSASHYGNRFLMPALALLAPALALACERLGAMLSRRSSAAAPAPADRPLAP